jgi:hypothetical protein
VLTLPQTAHHFSVLNFPALFNFSTNILRLSEYNAGVIPREDPRMNSKLNRQLLVKKAEIDRLVSRNRYISHNKWVGFESHSAFAGRQLCI